MTLNISDLMDGLGDETLELYGDPPVSAERVLALAAERGGAKPRKKPRKTGRILLVAAALAALLSVTAYAVYERFVEDYVIDQQQPDPLGLASEDLPGSRLSLVGYQGTPEYEAFTEWEALQEDWWQESMARLEELGLTGNNTWHETPDNYYFYYDAATMSQGLELDAIMEKYGLRLHEHRSTLLREGGLYTTLGLESLCALLEMDVFIRDSGCDAYGGYVYDDGTFKLEASANGEEDAENAFDMFLSAKGSFTTITRRLPEIYEQWSYTAGSRELTLALSGEGGVILAELPGAYVYLSNHSHSRADLEALADAVDFDALAARFDGTPLDLTDGMAEMDEKYNAWLEQYMAEHDPHPESAALPAFDDAEQQKQWVLSRLGDWAWDGGPEGYGSVWRQALCQPDGVRQINAESVDVYALYSSSYYYSQTENKGLSLIYKRVFSGPELTESVTDAEFQTDKQLYPDGTVFDLDGREALYVPEDMSGAQSALYWLDRERDLVFQLCVSGERASLETLQSLAEALIADMDAGG